MTHSETHKCGYQVNVCACVCVYLHTRAHLYWDFQLYYRY